MGCKVGESGLGCSPIGPGWQGSSHPATPVRITSEGTTLTFRGTFDLTLDAKNRLAVPARYRAAFAEGAVLAAGLEDCVAIWRPADYDAWTAAALAGHSPLSPEFRKLKRHFTANSHPTELDGAGRVMVPKFLLESGRLAKDVSVVGAGECLEIWDRGVWASYNGEVLDNVSDIAAGLHAAG
jgi:MraZ protein